MSSDPRSKSQQVWTLKREQAPRCRACSRIQSGDELTVNVKGFCAPYEQNFVTEIMLYLCPKQQYINSFPHWANLKPSDLTCDQASLLFIFFVAVRNATRHENKRKGRLIAGLVP